MQWPSTKLYKETAVFLRIGTKIGCLEFDQALTDIILLQGPLEEISRPFCKTNLPFSQPVIGKRKPPDIILEGILENFAGALLSHHFQKEKFSGTTRSNYWQGCFLSHCLAGKAGRQHDHPGAFGFLFPA